MSDRDKKPSYTDYDENRLSWREKDRRKDKRNVDEVRKSQSPKQKYQDEKAKKDYLKNLNTLFGGKKSGKEHDKELKALKESFSNKVNFKQNVEAYIQKYGFPDDWDVLLLLLKLNDRTILKQTLEVLRTKIETIDHTKKRILKSEIEILKMTTFDKELKGVLNEFIIF